MQTVSVILMIILMTASTASNVFAKTLFSTFIKERPKLIMRLTKSGLEESIVKNTLYDFRIGFYPELLKSIAGEGYDYFDPVKGIFTEQSLQRGRKVVIENEEVLSKIERRFEIPKEILVGIYRVETNLGRNVGRYVVVNSLLTWTVSGTRRTKWAESELFSYLTICKYYKYDPFDIWGSSHGAFGLMQFIPSSFLLYAVKYENSFGEEIDPFDFADAMSSAANYLRRHKHKNDGIKKAIYAYNHNWQYVKAVMQYSDRLK